MHNPKPVQTRRVIIQSSASQDAHTTSKINTKEILVQETNPINISLERLDIGQKPKRHSRSFQNR